MSTTVTTARKNGLHLLVVGQMAIVSSLDIVTTAFGDGIVVGHAGRLIEVTLR